MTRRASGGGVVAFAAVDMDVSRTTKAIFSGSGDEVIFHNKFTGSTPTGVFTYEGSLDPLAGNNDAAGDWVPLTVDVVHGDGDPTGTAGNQMVVLRDVPMWVRQIYTDGGSAAADKLTTWITTAE